MTVIPRIPASSAAICAELDRAAQVGGQQDRNDLLAPVQRLFEDFEEIRPTAGCDVVGIVFDAARRVKKAE